MSQSEAQSPRISEKAENFERVFNMSVEAAENATTGALEPQEATATARNIGNAIKVIDSDLKSRLVEHRLKARTVNAPQIAARAS